VKIGRGKKDLSKQQKESTRLGMKNRYLAEKRNDNAGDEKR